MSFPPHYVTSSRQLGFHRSARADAHRVLLVGAAAAGVCLVALGTGWLVASDHVLVAIVICLALPVTLLVAWAGPAAIAGVIVVLMLNGLPGVNLASFNVHGSFEAMDICAIALILLAAARSFFDVRERVDRRTQQLIAWSILFLAVWMIAFFNGLDRGVPALKAALFGRDFLFFALLVPIAKALVKTEGEMTRLFVVVGVLATVYALGEIAASVGVLSPHLINARHTLAEGHLTRVYTPMNDLIALGFACGTGYALLNTGRRAILAAVVATICGVGVILQLTRAMYVGLTIGMVIAFIIWASGRFRLRTNLRRRVLWTVGTIGFVVLAVVVMPQVISSSSIQTIISRVGRGFSDVNSSNKMVAGASNTLAYRQNVSSLMLQVLGSQWVLGLGFLHPAVVYFPQLPNGSIRNNDLGLFNSLMTMGVIGTVLIYVPVLIALGDVFPRRPFEGERGWLRLGGMIWLISVIAGSLTLVTLFSPNGLVLTAVLLGVIFRDSQLRKRRLVAADGAPSTLSLG